uniref:Uncharacterized protein n=1 Tax=Arion vulgaris TaxID=1028688 RepID=A0A0B6ZHB2_9EUPU
MYAPTTCCRELCSRTSLKSQQHKSEAVIIIACNDVSLTFVNNTDQGDPTFTCYSTEHLGRFYNILKSIVTTRK